MILYLYGIKTNHFYHYVPSCVLLTFLANKQIDGFHGPATLVSVTEMGSLSVVVVQPGIEIGLEQLDALIEGLPQLDPEELSQDRAVEPLHESVRLRRRTGSSGPNLTPAVLDPTKFQLEFVAMPLATTELAPVEGRIRWIGQDWDSLSRR